MDTLYTILHGPYGYLVYIQLGIVGILFLWLIALLMRRAIETFRKVSDSSDIDSEIRRRLGELNNENMVLKAKAGDFSKLSERIQHLEGRLTHYKELVEKAAAPTSEVVSDHAKSPRTTGKPLEELIEQIDSLRRSAGRA